MSAEDNISDIEFCTPEEMWKELFGDEPMPNIKIKDIVRTGENSFEIITKEGINK